VDRATRLRIRRHPNPSEPSAGSLYPPRGAPETFVRGTPRGGISSPFFARGECHEGRATPSAVLRSHVGRSSLLDVTTLDEIMDASRARGTSVRECSCSDVNVVSELAPPSAFSLSRRRLPDLRRERTRVERNAPNVLHLVPLRENEDMEDATREVPTRHLRCRRGSRRVLRLYRGILARLFPWIALSSAIARVIARNRILGRASDAPARARAWLREKLAGANFDSRSRAHPRATNVGYNRSPVSASRVCAFVCARYVEKKLGGTCTARQRAILPFRSHGKRANLIIAPSTRNRRGKRIPNGGGVSLLPREIVREGETLGGSAPYLYPKWGKKKGKKKNNEARGVNR